jgi:N-acetylmuramoyl-L-alanine amidase
MRRRRRRLWALVAVVAAVVLVLVMPGHRSAARSAPRSAPTADTRPVATGQFSPGACVTMAPLAGNRHLTVFIDAGHGGVDPGGVGTTESGQQVEEANLTLPVELDAADVLRGDGFTVTVSRTGATNVARLGPADVNSGALTVQGAHDDVAARAVCANLAGAQLLVGIYFDAGSSPTNAGSVTGYDAVRPFSAANLRLAQLLQSDVLSAMNAQGWAIPDEGVLTDDSLGSATSSAATAYGHLMLLGPAETGYFTTPSQMPGALIEPLFITDPFEASIAAGSQGQEVIAGGIARAVQQYFGVP